MIPLTTLAVPCNPCWTGTVTAEGLIKRNERGVEGIRGKIRASSVAVDLPIISPIFGVIRRSEFMDEFPPMSSIADPAVDGFFLINYLILTLINSSRKRDASPRAAAEESEDVRYDRSPFMMHVMCTSQRNREFEKEEREGDANIDVAFVDKATEL